jgi:hypothetical protein
MGQTPSDSCWGDAALVDHFEHTHFRPRDRSLGAGKGIHDQNYVSSYDA